MSHKSKSKAKGINATSFFDLKAELSKHEADFAKAKASGKSTSIVGGVKRPDKKPTVWARQNKGVASRAGRDVELEEISKPTLDSARAALERKAKIYDKLRKGKTGGLNDAQYDALLVDFDEANPNTSKYYQEDSEDEDESLTVPKRFDDGDPMVEYEDEFGRLRTAPRSEVPRNLMLNREDEVDPDEDILIRNPVNHFPIYQPSEERIAEIAKAHADENNPLGVHYDAAKEIRAKGAGFYQFSADEETRAAQMEELKASREETERIRADLGAEDVRAGEIEGMRASGPSTGTVKSRAMEKRKRELEERRKLLESKRRRLRPNDESAPIPVTESSNALPDDSAPQDLATKDSTPLKPSPLEAQSIPQPNTRTVVNETVDPFAALEAQTVPSTRPNHKKGPAVSENEADFFLAQLESEFLGSRNRKPS
ncbi:hypothetical protein HYPSUDRAFT_138494 [Hypholoma sublateritium FD-334 SS-4]|uniref:Uncharacterized protein n=1 Tax=Hypholoma sublateritium (strain FD-334 SS-4) TaxID=945553 RepID=A0A0D2P2D0_HYPSF|nr:hypothetical protein HYPSUDRAFT_138494 [Hypholoma sublateritium FD-334 SS-4]